MNRFVLRRGCVWLALVAFGLLVGAVSSPAQTADRMSLAPAAAEERAAEAQDFLVNLLWIQVDRYWHWGEYDRVVSLCRKIIVLDPHDIEAYTNAAWLLWSSDKDEEATAWYKEAMVANPEAWEPYWEYAFFLRARKRFAEAIEPLREAVARGAPGKSVV